MPLLQPGSSQQNIRNAQCRQFLLGIIIIIVVVVVVVGLVVGGLVGGEVGLAQTFPEEEVMLLSSPPLHSYLSHRENWLSEDPGH